MLYAYKTYKLDRKGRYTETDIVMHRIDTDMKTLINRKKHITLVRKTGFGPL